MVAEEWDPACRCRICVLRRTATSGKRFGLPLICPKCRARGSFYGVLKVPGERAPSSCPNCGSDLIARRAA